MASYLVTMVNDINNPDTALLIKLSAGGANLSN